MAQTKKLAQKKPATSSKSAAQSKTSKKSAPVKAKSAPKTEKEVTVTTAKTTPGTTQKPANASKSLTGTQIILILVIAVITFVAGFYIGEISMKSKISKSFQQMFNSLNIQTETEPTK